MASLGVLLVASCNQPEETEILIAGGGTGGIAAGIQSARMGVSTLIVEENEWLGGMLTSAGVSAVDGNYKLMGGIWKEFFDSLSVRYGGAEALKTGWVSNVLFEPHAGNQVFANMAAAEGKLEVKYRTTIISVKRLNNGWMVKLESGGKIMKYRARILIDGTELGDLAAMTGIPYDVGMDSRDDTGEDIAPEHTNDIVQDLTYVAILKDYGHDVSIPRPEHYDPLLFACSCENPLCTDPLEEERLWPAESMISYGKLPNEKYMINWPIEGNDYYVNMIEMDRGQRLEAMGRAKERTMEFIYFIQSELGYRHFGLADDEFPTEDLLPFIPYHRESRRIHGKVKFTIQHITAPYEQPQKLYRTTVAVGDYPVDHHHKRYEGADSLPDLHFYPVPSYGLPLGTLIPEKQEGILVAEKSISVSNLVNGTTRLQPVVLQIGQAAGVLASLACRQEKPLSEISVREVQQSLLDHGAYLLPYLDVEPGHPWFRPMQRIGATGVMKGIGRNSGWENQTFFRAYDTTRMSDLTGLKELYQLESFILDSTMVTLSSAAELMEAIAEQNGIELDIRTLDLALEAIGIESRDNPGHPLLRGEMAVLLDKTLNPFRYREVDLQGKFMDTK
jgi:hypothetical protein